MGSGHTHSAGRSQRGRLVLVLAITVSVLIVELVGAAVTNSLALFADAGHLLTDVAGIALAVIAVSFAAKLPTLQRTYGYYRLEILAAVVNGVLLFGVALFIVISAVQRWQNPPEVEGGLMLVFASVGLVANGVALILLRPGAKDSLNVKGAYLEVVGDLLGSVAVIVAALVITLTGWLRVDPLVSILVALLILPRTWLLLRDAIDVLLEATPRGIDLERVRAHILEVPGVISAHDLHVWTITSGMPVLSVHVVVADHELMASGPGRILDQLAACLSDHFDVEHCTFQIEPSGHSDHEHASHT